MTSPTSLLDFQTAKKYLARIGGEPRSLLTAVVKKEYTDQYYTDVALIKFTKQGEVNAPEGYAPTDDEAKYIQVEMSGAKWPNVVFIPENDPALPDKVKQAPEENISWFRDTSGNILMGQLREVIKGKKYYRPLTKWDDGEYRWAEPDGKLPLFGLENLKGNTTVYLHEGSKGAKKCQRITEGKEDHPWQQELSNAAHLGWIGGALNPNRTDFSVLRKHGVTRIYIVLDNDISGISALPKIARELDCVTFGIQFSDQWPKSFDLGDDFPKSMFSNLGGKSYYIGPSWRDCVIPATWMTDLVPMINDAGKVKMVPVLRQHAKGLWQYIEEYELFVLVEKPDVVRKAESLNAMLKAFSDTNRISDLILGSFTGRTPRLVYRPDIKGSKVVVGGETGINTYIAPSVKPQEGDITPWLEFTEYLIPNENDRYEFMRWCATLIARPADRIGYAMLLISKETGIGKTIVGERVLAPLVGLHNCAFPSETDVVDSQFNSWLMSKRLAVIAELYAGASYRAFNKLKSVLTDKYVDINQKYMPVMRMENWIHVYACSNSEQALMVDEQDRRWFAPTVTEERWPKHKFGEFLAWVDNGGLAIIAHWAATFGDYIHQGERAPMTERKRSMIEESKTGPEREIFALTESVASEKTEVAFSMSELFQWGVRNERGKVYDKPLTFQNIAKKNGFEIWNGKDRLYVYGRLQAVLLSPALRDKVSCMTRDEAREYVKSMVKLPGEVMGGL